MEAKNHTTDDRIAELKTQRAAIEAFRDGVKDADKTELKAMFGKLMSKVRGYRALDGSISMLVHLDDDGTLVEGHYVACQRGSYVAPDFAKKCDAHLSVGTGAFVSYEDIRESVLYELAQALEGTNDNIRALDR